MWGSLDPDLSCERLSTPGTPILMASIIPSLKVGLISFRLRAGTFPLINGAPIYEKIKNHSLKKDLYFRI